MLGMFAIALNLWDNFEVLEVWEDVVEESMMLP